MLVYTKDQAPWFLSAIYASQNPIFRQDLWDSINCLGQIVMIPWLLVGDFNQIVCYEEKKRGNMPSIGWMDAFLDVIRKCELIDLGFSGPCFTWSDMRKGLSNVQERLDMALYNHLWLQIFSSCLISHLPRPRSDHCPLLV